MEKTISFLIQSADHKGIIARVSGYFYELGFNILSCQQFTDTQQDAYFMRISLDGSDLPFSRAELEERFAAEADTMGLSWSVDYHDRPKNVALLVTKASHCLFDLLERQHEGKLRCHIPLIIGNHPTLEYVANQFKIPFYCVPVEEDKRAHEGEILSLLKKHYVDLVVLARYMRILSPEFIAEYPHRIINIHHAMLPAFKGANPYRRAYERGVKMIGATAHYATDDLDEGPIIEQDVMRVSHASMPKQLARLGEDVERKVLSTAVKYHLEHRVIVHGIRTVVFPESNE
ncbi:MAG: formyltetrahydrofolate deformylase [Bacteroidota bacterium]